MDVGQSALDAVVVIRQSAVIESHQVQQRRVEVVDRRDVLDRFEPEFIAGPVGVTGADAGTGEEAGERAGVVVAAGPVGLQERHPTEFGAPHHQRVIQHAAGLEVRDQRRGRLIHDLRLHRVRLRDVTVRVPIGDAVAA